MASTKKELLEELNKVSSYLHQASSYLDELDEDDFHLSRVQHFLKDVRWVLTHPELDRLS